VPNLRVVARTSAFAFKGKNSDIREIGKKLNVNAVLEGSVRKSGDQLRITAQLNRVADGYHLWSRTYDRQMRDVLAVQREISQAIANQLRAGQVPHREHTRDPEAYRLYEEGKYFFNQHIPPDSYLKAIQRYQQAIARDSHFALAYAGLADAWAYQAEDGVMPAKEVMPKAKEAGEKAVAIDDNLAEAHASLGIVKLDFDRDVEGAQREIRRALELNPGSSWVHHWYAHSLEAQGRLPEAMAEMQSALDLDPLSEAVHWDIDAQLYYTKRYDEGLQRTLKDLELFPEQPILKYFATVFYFLKGDIASGARAAKSLKSFGGPPETDVNLIGFSGYAAAVEGRVADARRALERLENLRKTEYVDFFMPTQLCNALHNHQQLMVWLQRGHDDRSPMWVYIPLQHHLYEGDAAAEAYVKQNR
jgi:tetratricopeptide (TPR) repeat protein